MNFMQNRILIRELSSKLGESVVVAGWLHRLRDLSKFGFAILRDRTGLVQVVLTAEQLESLRGLQVETVLKVTGQVVKKQSKDPNANEVEIQATTLEVLSPVRDVVPVEVNKEDIDVQLETLLDNRVITLRNPKQRAIFRVQAALVHGFRQYMEGQEFTEIFFPVLAGAASEGGAEFFRVEYYGREATLTQSAQLYKQITMGVYEGVYGVSYSFRAEKFATSRHLTEFNQLEFEVGFVDFDAVRKGKFCHGDIPFRATEKYRIRNVVFVLVGVPILLGTGQNNFGRFQIVRRYIGRY